MSQLTIGFCGADDETNISEMINLSNKYGNIEWGILFHPTKTGNNRYPSKAYVKKLGETVLPLAGHLCGAYCMQVLQGDTTFVKTLKKFKRFQVNATIENEVVFVLNQATEGLAKSIKSCPEIEWILQYNTQTKYMCRTILSKQLPNVSILYDASCGTGITISSFGNIERYRKVGFAGGISNTNISNIVNDVRKVPECKWIDMESGVRTNDIFDIEKCKLCMIQLNADIPI